MMAQRPLRFDTPEAVRRSLAKVANETRSGALSPPQANAMTAAANAFLSSIRADVQEKRLAELEKLLTDIERGQ